MRSLELCKALKENGFPQKGQFWLIKDPIWDGSEIVGYSKDFRREYIPDFDPLLYTGEFILEPTLSELIEACGDDVVLHGPDTPDVGEGYWCSPKDVWSIYKPELSGNILGLGQTLEEAVANLYLALNKK